MKCGGPPTEVKKGSIGEGRASSIATGEQGEAPTIRAAASGAKQEVSANEQASNRLVVATTHVRTP